MNALTLSLTPSISSNKPFLIKGFRVSQKKFSNFLPIPPPHLKMRPPHLKNTPPPPPLKREVPFQEMIPRKSTINNNLKSS